MMIRFLFFTVFTLFNFSDASAQILVKRATSDQTEINGYVKKAKSRSYEKGPDFEFGLNLLKYKNDNPSSTSSFSYNEQSQKTRVVHEFFWPQEKTGITKGNYEYENGLLVESFHQIDSFENRQKVYQYKFDNDDRITQVIQLNNDTINQLEEVSYSSEGIRSIIFFYHNRNSQDTIETFMNGHGEITKQKSIMPSYPEYSYFHEKFYTESGQLRVAISRRHENVDYFFNVEGKKYCGRLQEYVYSPTGVLKMTKTYFLKNRNPDATYGYTKSEVFKTTKYREKQVDGYILQTVQEKYKGHPAEIISQKILDHNRSTIIDNQIEDRNFTVWEISYY